MPESTTLSLDGRVTIPREVRERLGLQAGDKLAWALLSNGTIVCRPKTGRLVDLAGVLDKASEPGVGISVEEMRLPEWIRDESPGCLVEMADLAARLERQSRWPTEHLAAEFSDIPNGYEVGKTLIANISITRDRLSSAMLMLLSHAVYREPERPDAPSAAHGDARDLVPDLLAHGRVMPAADFARRMRWSRQALSKALQSRRVFFLESGGERCYPAFYLDAKLDRGKLEAVTRLLGDLPGPSKWLFFTQPKASLAGATPLEALARGKVAAVRAAAEGYAQR